VGLVKISEESLEPALRRLMGTEIGGRIRIDEPIGIGGMGVVFRGFQHSLSREVAIKVAHPSLGVEQATRFEREAKMSALLDNPHCITVYEFGKHMEMQYMVMPLLRGEPLAVRMRLPISTQQAIEMGIQILEGLQHAHSRGVVHRDLKPENIVITEEAGSEVLKIVDFGIAKVIQPNLLSSSTMSGLLSGTPEYMSPEQALGLPTDARSDLYSAGIIVYHMIAGALPFIDDDPIVQLRRHITDEVPPLPLGIPPPVARVVLRMVRKERDERYQTASEALRDFEALRKGAAYLPSDSGLPEPPAYASLPSGRYDAAEDDFEPARASSLEIPAPQLSGSAHSASASATLSAPRNRVLLWLGAAGAAVGIALTVGFAVGRDVDTAAAEPRPASPEQTDSATPATEADLLEKLAAVNESDPAKALDFATRHAYIEELEASAKTAKFIDRPLNLAMDLRQAADSPTPCTTFSEALEGLPQEPGNGVVSEALAAAQPPRPGVVPRAGEPPDGPCDHLAQKREALLAAFAARPPTAPTTPAPSDAEAVEVEVDEPVDTPSKRPRKAAKPAKPAASSKPSKTAEPKASSPPRPAKTDKAAPWERRTGAEDIKNPFN
jgi:serine/threonine protein kinase